MPRINRESGDAQGGHSKVAGAWGRPSIHLELTDIRVKHRGWAGRNCFVPSLPVSEDTSPARTMADLRLGTFRTLRLRQCLWYEVIQLMVFFITEELVQVLHWPQFPPLLEGVHLCFPGKFRAPSPSSPSSDGLTIASGNTSVPKGGPLPLYPGEAVARVLLIVFPAGLLYHQVNT